MKKLRSLFSVGSAILILVGCATGSSVVTGSKRIAIDPGQVRVVQAIPLGAEVIATVEASSDMGFTAQGSLDYAVEELKKQAARVGANVVVLVTLGSSKDTKHVTGIAAFSK